MSVEISVRSSDSIRYDLRVNHPSLAGPFHRTLDDDDEARLLGERVVAALDRGQLPTWIAKSCRVRRATIAGAIREYRASGLIPESQTELFNTLSSEVGATLLNCVCPRWGRQWIERMKNEKQSASETVRKKAAALQRLLVWLQGAHPRWVGDNSFLCLTYGYAIKGYGTHARPRGTYVEREVPMSEILALEPDPRRIGRVAQVEKELSAFELVKWMEG